MANRFASAAAGEGAHECDRSEMERSQTRDQVDRARERDQWLQHLRQAMNDTGWTIDALAAHWGIHRSHVQRLYDGDKPWSVDRLLSLPDDLEARLEAIRAEYFGLIVVEPLRGLEAQKAIVAGLIGLMSPQLPTKAGKPVKAGLAASRKKTEVA